MPRTKIKWHRKLGIGFALAGVVSLSLFAVLHLEKASAPMTPFDGIGGKFSLTNQDGLPVTDETYKGKPTLTFFGFTHCPEVCPTTLYDLSAQLKELGNEADKLNVIFVTVDPERDTQASLKDYLKAFDPHLTALTGTHSQIDTIVKAFHVYAKKIPLDGGGYTMDHTASIFAADRQGRVVMLMGYQEAPEMVRAKLRRLLDMT